ncbi:MAG TPA: hypothetical protein PLR06_05400 [Cyclobacteriaceae bacterium]|nr:hypothetical protein [Cyclobacteriaceae bacterium]
MNTLQEVLREHSKTMHDRVVRYVGNNPIRFKELVDTFLKGPYRVTQRAAWPLSYCVESHPALIKPHLKSIINNLKTPGIPVSVKRNTIRLLQFIPIPRSLHGTVAEIGFNFLSDPKETIAVRVFSMTVLAHIAKEQPDIRKELQIVIEDQLPFGSAGFVSRANKVLKQLKH